VECAIYSIITNQAAIIALFRVMNRAKARIKRSAPRGWFAIALPWRAEELRWWQPCSWPNERHNVRAKTEIAPVA
jgi:hypothetical protein